MTNSTPETAHSNHAKNGSDFTIPRMVFAAAARYANHPVLQIKRDGGYHDITWDDFSKGLRGYCNGLVKADLDPGDRVAIMAPNGPDWVWADIAIQSCGGVSVPIYHTEGIKNVLYILKDCSCRFLFLYSATRAAELVEHLDDVPQLEKIILLRGTLKHARIVNSDDFPDHHNQELDERVNQRIDTTEPDQLASIVYTSGTTGPPKGVMLTHENFLSNVRQCCQLFRLGPRDTCLSFLPLSHVFERMAGYYLMLSQGVTIAYAESIDTVPSNLVEARPTVVISVPRLYEKMYARVMDKIVSSSWLKRKIFLSALDLCIKRIDLELEQRPVPWWLQKTSELARDKVFARLRSLLGGRLRYFVSGGAPLSRKVAEFFIAAGIPIYEGYGLTETSPVIAVNTCDAQRLGTVGQVLPNTRVKISDDGEILVAGPGVFQGYWNNDQQTSQALDGEWFHTGDIGEIDSDGFLSITDRKKDLIVTAGGENIAPQTLEQQLKSDKFIANALVYGDNKPFLTALLIPNFDNLSRYAKMKKIDFLTYCDLVNHPKILALIRTRIEKIQKNQPDFMKVRRVTLLSRDFLMQHGELTQTLKVKRQNVAEIFHQVIEGMYEAKDHGIHDHGYCILDEEEQNN